MFRTLARSYREAFKTLVGRVVFNALLDFVFLPLGQ